MSLIISLNLSSCLIKTLEEWGRPTSFYCANVLTSVFGKTISLSLSVSLFETCQRKLQMPSPTWGGGGKWGLTVLSQMITRQLLAVKTQCTSLPPLSRVGGSTGRYSKSLFIGLQSPLSTIWGMFCSLKWKLIKLCLSWCSGVFKMAHPLTFPALQSILGELQARTSLKEKIRQSS